MQLQILKSVFDTLWIPEDPLAEVVPNGGPTQEWVELCEDIGIPVNFGVPAFLTIDDVEYAVFDDPRITFDQVAAVVGVLNGL